MLNPAVIILATTFACVAFACGDPLEQAVGDETASGGTSGDATTGDTSSADTDGDDGDTADTGDEPPPVCDLDSLETRSPVWVEPLAQPDEAYPMVMDVALAAEGIFVGVGSYLNGIHVGGQIERRDLDGALQWQVAETGYTPGDALFGWDEEHLYFAAESIRRLTADGTLDETWWLAPEFGDAYFNVMTIDGAEVVAAQRWYVEEHPKETGEWWSMIIGVTKNGGPGAFSADPSEGVPNRRVSAIAPIADGGYVAAIVSNDVMYIWPFGGPSHHGVVGGLDGSPYASLLLEHPEGLLIGGSSRSGSSFSSWTRVIDASGTELWGNEIEPCGPGVSTMLSRVAVVGERIVGIAGVDVGSNGLRSIVVELDLDGALVAAYRIEGMEGDTWITSIDARDEVVVAGGGDRVDGNVVATWVARLQ